MAGSPVVVPARTIRRRRSRRWGTRDVLIGLAVLVVVTGLSWLPARAATDRLEGGRAAMVRGLELLSAGNANGAQRAFALASEEFLAASRAAEHPLIRLGGSVPLAGRSYEALGTLARIGGRTAAAGARVTTALAEIPGGLGSLAPRDGRIPVEEIGSLLPSVSAARAELEAASRESQAMPTSYLVGPVESAADLVRDEVGSALRTTRSAEALLRALPSFVGAEGPRRYFVAAQSPAELRGTGGFIGSYAILTAREGRLKLGPFREISVLRNVSAEAAPAPSDAFREIWDRFGGAGFWRNLNMTPDVPTAASMIEDLYERVEGTPLDGTIFVNPQVLSELLEATGPVHAPIVDRTLTAEGIVDYLANGAYEEFGFRAGIRKRVLGIAATSVFRTFLQGPDPDTAVSSMIDAASGGHLTLHAADPEIQSAFRSAGVAGELGTPRGDFFGLFTSDASGTKVDYYVRREIRYEVTLGANGSASVEASIVFHNDAPAGAAPSYVLGPYPGTGLAVGEELSFASVYCAPGCEMTGATEDGEPAGMEVHREHGLRSLHRYIRVEPQASRTLDLSLRIRRAWEGDDASGTYRLHLQGQATIRPTDATVLVRVPEGMRIVGTTDSMRVIGDEAVWRGTFGSELDLEVRFRRPLAGRIWRTLWGG